MKYFFVIVVSSVYWHFRSKTPSQSEIFFFKSILLLVLFAGMYVLAFQDQYTLPKWNIFCYCTFFCILAFQDQYTLPKWNIFFKAILLLVLSTHMYVLAFQDQNILTKWNIFFKAILLKTSSQSEIFLVIVVDPLKVKYFFQRYSVACSLYSYVCSGLSKPKYPPKVKYFFKTSIPSQSEIFFQSYSVPEHPPKVKYFFLIVVSCVY